MWASGQARRPRAVTITASERICGQFVAPVSLPKSDTGQRSGLGDRSGRLEPSQRGPGRIETRSGRTPPRAERRSVSLVLYVSPDSTCWSALDPPVFRGSRCRRVLTPPADNYTRPFLAAAGPAVRRSVSRWSARRRSLWPNDLYTRRRTAIIAAPRKGPHTRSGVGSHRQTPPVDQQLDLRLIDKWRQDSPTEPVSSISGLADGGAPNTLSKSAGRHPRAAVTALDLA